MFLCYGRLMSVLMQFTSNNALKNTTNFLNAKPNVKPNIVLQKLLGFIPYYTQLHGEKETFRIP